MPVELRRGGLHLSGTALWLDAHRKAPLAFVSHAHADHIARHERVIATRATLRLMSHRLGELPSALPVPFNRPFDLGPLTLELLPAGHILGSAQLRIIRSDGRRVVYSGDLNLAGSATAEPAQVAECDTLVLESTFGHPRYRFPPKEEVFTAIERFVQRTLEQRATPILLGYSLGKGQEAIRALTAAGHPVVAHASVCAVAEVYRSLGVEVGPVRRFDGTWLPGEVGVFPPHLWRFGRILRPWPRRTAVLTGWAVDPGAARRYGTDEAFPLSDHADSEGLVRYARATGASEVLTHHGFAEELARMLRHAGIEARPLGTVRQLELFG
jgi:putative mRNA 3-end processing factor